MDTFEIVFYILKVIGVLLPIVFYGVKLHKELRDAHTRKSEPSVVPTLLVRYSGSLGWNGDDC